MIQRLQDILKKDTISLSFLGGSVTEGFPYSEYITQPYPELVLEKLNQLMQPTTFQMQNYARCGYKSSHALLSSDTLLPNHENHIIFLEYALNDDMSKESVIIYESLICKLIRRKENPAIIALLLPSKKELSIGNFMKKICIHYNIPYIDFTQLLHKEIQNGILLPDDYWFDFTHPNQHGHHWISCQICDFLMTQNQTPSTPVSSYCFPQNTFLKNSYKDLKTIKLEEDISYPLTFKIHCSIIWISYVQHEEDFMGNLQVFIDHEFVCNLHGKSFYCWYYPIQTKIWESYENSTHTITFQMAPGDEKKKFILEYIGYIE